MRSAVEHREDVLGADRLAPRERAARMVEAEHHPDVDVLARADALADGEARLVDELGHDAPEHEARRVAATHTVRRPSAAKSSSTRSAAGGAVPGPRVSSTSGEPSSGGSTWKPTAPPPPSRRVQRAVRAQQRDGPALQRRALGIGAAVDQQPRDLALGLVLVARVEAGRARPARAAPGRRRPRPRRPRAGPSPPPGAGGAGSSARSRGYSYQPRPLLRPRRPAATIRALSGEGRQRGSPKLSSWKESETS